MKDLSYYKKLDFNKIYSWKPEDFSGFLIWDQINAFKSAKDGGDLEPAFLNYFEKITKKYDRYKFFLAVADYFFKKLWLKNNKKNGRILFHTTKYDYIISAAKKHLPSGFLAGGRADRLFAFKNFLGYINISDLSWHLWYYFKEKDISYLHQLIKKLEEKLSILKPDYVVLNNDGFPIERAIILACKKLGICTIEIQHGQIFKHLLFGGRVVDYFLVWGQYYKDLYVNEKQRKPEEIYILGYPYKICKSKTKNKKYKVYYLGQNIETFRADLTYLKLKTINELDKLCKDLNMDFVYRPHPRTKREFIKNNLPQVKITPENEELSKSINNGDIFISFYSTSLIETAMRSKIALQLINYPITTENFEEFGGCTKSFRNIGQLKDYLKEITKDNNFDKLKPGFNNNYVETRYDPGMRFLEIIKEINVKRFLKK
jgi:hypothetical protein